MSDGDVTLYVSWMLGDTEQWEEHNIYLKRYYVFDLEGTMAVGLVLLTRFTAETACAPISIVDIEGVVGFVWKI